LKNKRKIAGHISVSAVTDIYYISKREKGHEWTLEFILNLIEVVNIIGIDSHPTA